MHPFLVISIHSYDRIILVDYKEGNTFEVLILKLINETDIYLKKLNSK